jgi:hypothetical protein
MRQLESSENPDALFEAAVRLRDFDADGPRFMEADGRAFYMKHVAMDESVRRKEQTLESVVAIPVEC